ncbi:acyl-CoA synthetase (AMP-forming)/AMP-acid ligase II [Saccharothrix ecbatanensis]|uniref:Acyl-CoA synthetase (AMP-forming)/AMP-acid ligase II n=1 Tax=Saccharothrix ecbatanensis TaxID=1105145 RepID=A0A7W9HK72_9PSEU|nr:class I adenylate-forming enzyme family protein [Saccharothrix ecbatanensis]MBB5803812.1 acyl-CoA synthetase (AMP-forming)/AMP-acid ligase II [Saccharothrix ecbatanensis]
MLTEIVTEHLRHHRDRVAVTDPTIDLTGSALLAERDAFATVLEGRVGLGDRPRVGLVAPNSAAYVTAYLAVLRVGGVPFLIDSAFTAGELTTIADDCSLDLLIHDERDLSALGGRRFEGTGAQHMTALHVTALPVDGRRYELRPDTEVCRFTSGSTGKPNCIEFTGDAVYRAAANWAAGTGLDAEDRTACFAALSNGLAFNTSLLATFLTGASLHLSRGLPTAGRVHRDLTRAQATRLVGFPALYESVVRRGTPALADVRVAVSSGAPLREETKRAFADLTGITISNYYGIAETGPLTFTTDPARIDGLGVPLPGVDLRAGVDGEPRPITVRSESMGSCYLNAPGVFEDRIDAEGLYVTGDEGFLRDGALVLTGRSNRMINVGGRKVDPVEVAEALRTARGVRDVVVFEATDQHGDPLVAAAVVSDEPLEITALRAHCAARLAAFKVPGRIHLLDRIPANSIGKPSLTALRRL